MDAARLSRRSVLGLVAATGLSGCTTVFPDYDPANDPYIPTMQKDPLFLWKPSADMVRTESYMSSLDHLAANDQSSILIDLRFRTSGGSAALLQEAQQVAHDAGYVNDRRELMPGITVMCNLFVPSEGNGVIINLRAPD
jgi:hypothetical protein